MVAFQALDAAAADDRARPNILFIIFDDWGWPHAGAYGCDWVKTPNFDRVAREGLLFNNAFTSNPKCSPCRASILTGRNTWQLEEAACHYGVFPSKFAVYPELLENAGYFVGYTGKGWGPGDWKAGGFTRNPAGPLFSGKTLTPPAKGISKVDYAGNFETFLDTRPAGQPFCFWMGFHEPHRGYEAGSGLRAGKRLDEVEVPPFFPDREEVRSDLLDYAVEVEWGDQQVGRALALLEKGGMISNTVVVVTSDHGMPFPRVKGQIYEDGFHLPMAIRWTGHIPPGRIVEDFVNVADLAPTWLALAGLDPHPQLVGRSLVPLLMSDQSGRIDASRNIMLTGKERHDLGRPNNWGYPVRAIRTPDFLYVRNFKPDRWPAGDPETGYCNIDNSPTKQLLIDLKTSGDPHWWELSMGKRPSEQLFNVRADPDCLDNLADDSAFAEIKAQLSRQMNEMLVEQGDPRALGNGDIFDTYQYTGGAGHSWEAVMGAPEPQQ